MNLSNNMQGEKNRRKFNKQIFYFAKDLST